MKNQYYIKKVYNPTALIPAFCIPMYFRNGENYMPVVDAESDTIIELKKASIEKNLTMPVLNNTSYNGKVAIYGFIFSPDKIIIGQRKNLEDILNLEIIKFYEYPFLLLEIGVFLRSEKIQNKAKSLYSKNLNQLSNKVIFENIVSGKSRSPEFKVALNKRSNNAVFNWNNNKSRNVVTGLTLTNKN